MGCDTAIQWPKHQGIKCYAVVSGQCWLSVEGVPDAVLLTAGDCFLLPHGLPFCLATDLSLTPVDFSKFLMALKSGEMAPRKEGGGHYIVGGHFVLTGSHADILLKSLPPIVHIRKESDKAAMRWSLERMKEELRDPQPGSSLISQQLAYMMLVQALRLHVAEGARGGVGWLFALADKQMSAAITCMHDDPGHPWTLQKLAERIGMSRSVFALRFKETVGTTPMEYLTRWRMLLAGDKLNNSGDSISVIALSLGYGSESAFGKAFKRMMGCSPRQYTRGSSSPPPSPITSGTSHENKLEVAAVG
ncbi:AraC family transcriptional regulator [Granulicella sp. L60]|uniref:AraC family transcriptional regulator n=1 Tax=Granulicella sp. L60 TaxID=1641866 RepID=UPI0020B14B55|nr:AraC family transcriptional regulator [Granulicella sp. L60]